MSEVDASAARVRAALGPGRTLLASCFDADFSVGGGLFAYDGGEPERLDDVSGTGLHFDGRRLLRCLWSDVGSPAELVAYDERGVVRYHRVDGVSNPHDVRWDGDGMVVVATAQNRVVWLGPGGDVERVWQPPGEPDSWHLNGLALDGGRLLVCAFGRFDRRKGWDAAGRPASGVLVDVETGATVARGLRAPHTPRRDDGGGWVVCNSDAGELVALDATGAVVRRAPLDGWPRGLVLAGDLVFVGVSPQRRVAPVTKTARVVVLERATWDVVASVDVPAREVYDLAVVPAPIADGVRRGFGANATRMQEQAQRALFAAAGVTPERLWAISDPLPRAAQRATLHALEPVPESVEPGALVETRWRVRNAGNAILTSAPPHPVELVSRWSLADGRGAAAGAIPAKLPRSLPPGADVEVPLWLRAPTEPGSYRVRVTLAQRGVASFDEDDDGCAADADVEVVGMPAGRGARAV